MHPPSPNIHSLLSITIHEGRTSNTPNAASVRVRAFITFAKKATKFLIQFNVIDGSVDFRCIEQNYQYLSCQWQSSSDVSCWSLTKSMWNSCENASFTQVFSTKTDKNVQLIPVKYIHSVWTSETEVNLTWPLPVYPCMTNNFTGGINCTATVSTHTSNVSTSSGEPLPKQKHQEKWTSISRPESGCFNLPALSLTFTSLQPSTRYKASVKCRPLGSVFWSGLTTCYFWTNITKPQGVPFGKPGSYVLYRCGLNNCLTLYWKMTRYHDEERLSYSLSIPQTSSTAVTDADITMATFRDLPMQHFYAVTIRAKNTAGTSAPLQVLIDTQTSDSYIPRYVSAMQVRPFTFEGDINWKEVPIGEVARYLDKYKYNLTTATEIEQHFAVAIVDHGKTSGMVWGETVYESQDPRESTSLPVLVVVLCVTAGLLLIIFVTIVTILKSEPP
uniref:Uncharacterized protein n=1 Tax=Magallana gigas TaxID=29159 RepID=K1R8H3_MAGGI